MHRRNILKTIALLLFALLHISGTTTMDAQEKKSAVLKEPFQGIFSLKQDQSNDELWDAFMLVKKANAGEAVAQHELGLCYLTGRNFFVDTAKAVHWISLAADQNLVGARYNLGILLNNGWGIAWNPFEAYGHFQYAAMHKMPEAQYVFGLLHTDNLVVAKNYPEAYRWITMAADSGYAPAKDILKEFNKRGITAQVTSQRQRDTLNKHTAATMPRDTTSSRIRPVYINFSSDSVSVPDDATLLREALAEPQANSGTPSNITDSDSALNIPDSIAIETIRSAAEAGSPEALTIMGRWHENGFNIKQDDLLASIYYIQAIRFDARWAPMLLWKATRKKGYYDRLRERVNKGDPAAKFLWAELVASGFDGQLTEAQTLQFLEDAAAQDYLLATVELGMWYYTGKFVSTNRERGEVLLKAAAESGNREAQIRLWIIELGTKEINTTTLLVDSLRLASREGSVLAQAMLGYCYQKGVGVNMNVAQSVYYYRRAAERGSETAYNTLKEMYAAIRPGDAVFQVGE